MKKLQPIYAVLITLFLLYAFSSNPPNATTGAPGEDNCTRCHSPGNANFNGAVSIKGLPDVIIPSTTYKVSVVTKISAGSPSRAGFQMVVLDGGNNNAGNLMNAGNSAVITNAGGKNYFEHDPALSFNGADSVMWTVDWTAPATIASDSVKVYINGILGNGSGSGSDLMVSEKTAYSFQTATALPVDVMIVASNDASCFGASDGSATVIASGGSGNYTYNWSIDSTTASISNLAIGRYIVTATDSDGATGTATVTINQPDEIIVSIDDVMNITCTDQVGNATANITGGVAPFTYLWSTNSTTASPALPAGMHGVTVTDASQCTGVATVTITEDTRAPVVFAGLDVTVTCADSNTTTAQLEAFNTTTGTGVNYLWTTPDGNIVSGATTLTPIIDASGIYILTVSMELNGCTAVDTAMATFNTMMPIANGGVDQQIDCTNATATLDGSASSQGDDLVYNWTTEDGNIMSGATTLMPIVTSGGTYILTVNDTVSSCSAMDTVMVTQDADVPEANAGMSSVLDCANETITLNGMGSTGDNITYLWTTADGNFVNGDTTLTPVIDSAGTYVLTVTNTINNCTAMSSLTVADNRNLPVISAGESDTLTCNKTTIILNGMGSEITDIIYVWTTVDGNLVNGDSTLNPIIDAPGTYMLTANNQITSCTATSAVVIAIDTATLMASAGDNQQIDCTNSTATLTGSGSEGGDIIYLWTTDNGNITTGETTLIPTVDAGGSYTLTVRDTISGCAASATVEVTQDATIPEVTVGTDRQIGCSDGDTLQILGNATMGDNIVYLWTTDGGEIIGATNTLQTTIVGVGTYTLTATDTLSSCSGDASFSVVAVTPPTADAGMAGILNCANEDLMLDASGSMGDNLIFEWMTTDGNIIEGNNTVNPKVDAVGTYELMVTDTLTGCTAVATVVITEDGASNLFAASGDAEQLTCNQTSLTLNATASEGENIVYEWTTVNGNIIAGGNTLMPTIDAPGRYFLMVRDTINGCSATSSININQDVTLPTVSAGDAQVIGCNSVSVMLSGSSETAFNLTYTWTTENGLILSGKNTPNPIVSAAGIYTLMVVDTFTNCAASASVEVTADDALPMVDAGTTLQLDCNTDTLTLTGTASVGMEFTTLWSTAAGNIIGDATILTPMVDQAGSYTLTVTDTTSGCTNRASVSVLMDVEKPSVEAGAAMQFLCDNSNLSITATASEGDNFTYFWCTTEGSIVNGGEALTVEIDSAGLFEFIVTNTANGCKNVDTVLVTPALSPQIAIDSINDTTMLVVTGGLLPYSYEWNRENISIDNDITGLPAGDYMVTVTDANGCNDAISFVIDPSTGLEAIEATIENLQVYPNPASSFVDVNITFKEVQAGHLFIMNKVGQQVWQRPFTDNNVNLEVEVADWPVGIYYLLIQTSKGVKAEEIVVVR